MPKTMLMILCVVASLLVSIGANVNDEKKGRVISSVGFGLLAAIVVFIIAAM